MFSNLPIVQNLVGEKPIITDDLYIENQIRENIDLTGTPIVLQFKNKGDE